MNMEVFKTFLLQFLVLSCFSVAANNMNSEIIFNHDTVNKKVDIFIGEKFFTSYMYPNDLEKQVLYPILTVSGQDITRGFPLNPRPFERTDHPHHIGLWFNFGDVNGLDFWNNSFAIKPEDKHKYGSIIFDKIIDTNSKKGQLTTQSKWVDYKGEILLLEKTTYRFGSEKNDIRTIERITELTAQQKVIFTENKEGLLGLRVDRAFEEPSLKAEKYLDSNGNMTETPVLNSEGVNGVYRNAEGLKGGEVWGKRSKWVALRANKDGEIITIVIMDNKNNPNYPNWSHARGYGLFATNNLAGRATDKNSEPVKLKLSPEGKVVFKHKIIIGRDISDKEINRFSENFNKQ
jgi:hypothetical protein